MYGIFQEGNHVSAIVTKMVEEIMTIQVETKKIFDQTNIKYKAESSPKEEDRDTIMIF